MAAIYAGTSATSTAGATTGMLPRVHSNQVMTPFLPLQPRTSVAPSSLRFSSESRRFSSFQIKASSTEETSTTELLDDLKDKWDKLENKSTVLVYGGGAIVAVWLSSIIVGAINSVPLLPKIMELVGLGYSGWFVYRYLLFKSSRKELAEDIESLKKKIAGTE